MTKKPNAHGVDCPYCSAPAKLVRVPASIKKSWRLIWRCDPCDAHVGCHKGTTEPLGTPAKPALRRLRNRAHMVFDQLWINEPSSRRQATRRRWYYRLSCDLGYDVHIGSADEAICQYVTEWANRHLAARENLAADSPIKRNRDAVQHG